MKASVMRSIRDELWIRVRVGERKSRWILCVGLNLCSHVKIEGYNAQALVSSRYSGRHRRGGLFPLLWPRRAFFKRVAAHSRIDKLVIICLKVTKTF